MHNQLFIAKKCVCCNSSDLQGSPAVMMPFVSHRALGYKPLNIEKKDNIRTISLGTAYMLCKSMSCMECGHLFLDIRFGSREMERLYNKYRGEDYSELRNQYEPGYKDRNKRLELGYDYIDRVEEFILAHIGNPLSVLDWGGDTGLNTPFKEVAKKIDVYDISDMPLVVDNARRVDEKTALGENYDVVVCSNVLEHMPEPIICLKDLTRYMNSRTLLYIEVPLEPIVKEKAEKDEPLCVKKKHWHEHINFFTCDSLGRCAEAAGLRVLEIKEQAATSGGEPSLMYQLACKLA
jgi:hypothetical protein